MKTHTSGFKEQIKLIGKEIDSRITFGSTVLGKNDLNAVTPSYQGAILKSVMKQLDIDSNVAIPIGTILKYEFGLKVNGEYEYINYGNYVVYSIEKQEDTNSYKITCYDKLLYSMLDYVKLPITYPISIRDYINAISTTLGLKFANRSETFANYDKQIQADLYDGLGYTFRDVLDELAQVTASTICLNNNDELEIRYITETNDFIDEEYLKDVNVNFGEKFGKVNTIVLSRSADSDSVYYPSVLPANPYEIKISDNQIMNGNDRADFLPDIYNKLNGLEFYTNDFVSTGIVYYDLCDRYSVKVGDTTYSCVMFNDEVLVTQGLEENVYTELPEQTETDYKHASKDDRMINQVYIIAKKNEAEILAVVNTTNQIQKEINPTKDESGSNITIEDASNNPLIYLEIEGKSIQNGTPTPDTPVEIESVGYTNLIPTNETEWEQGTINGGSNEANTTRLRTKNYIEINENTLYTFRLENALIGNVWFYDAQKQVVNNLYDMIFQTGMQSVEFTTPKNTKYYKVVIRYEDNSVITSQEISEIKPMIEKGSTIHSCIPLGKYGIEVKTTGKNLFNNSNIVNGFPNLTIGDILNYTNSGVTVSYEECCYVEIGKKYTISYKKNTPASTSSRAGVIVDKNNVILQGVGTWSNSTDMITFTANYSGWLIFSSDKNTTDIQIEEGPIATEYEEYKSNTTVLALNEPLRSLPNGVKDKAYIKNNKLYVDRYISSRVLNGTEGWNMNAGVGFHSPLLQGIVKNLGNGISNRYVYNKLSWQGNYTFSINSTGILAISDNTYSSVADFKTWLSNNNVQVDYELATLITEEYGEIEMLKTLKGYNNISTTDKLLPIINLTYVRDTVIADYVENHITELKLTENKIKASVESVSSSVDGLNTTINRVEEITNDNSQVINVISTNIDKTSGEVREVTTTTGFTLNKDGMTIDDGSGFKAEHRANGTYYKDGSSITGQYTKDGSKQKDLELFGTYSYGKETIDDTPMFVGQLYTDGKGEQGFGHFYNGEG